jgi:hypothetical protein
MMLMSLLLALGFFWAAFSLRRDSVPANPRLQDADGPWVAIVETTNWTGPTLAWRGYFAEEQQALETAMHETARLESMTVSGPEFGLLAKTEDRRLFELRMQFGYAQSFNRARDFSRFKSNPRRPAAGI